MKPLTSKKEIINFIQNDVFIMNTLRIAKSTNLPNWFIGAGFIRNTIWNIQHGYKIDYKYNDIDLAYFDNKDISEKKDKIISNSLNDVSELNWEVVNQAYASKYNNLPNYRSAIDGLSHWIETATCVGVTLDKNDNVIIYDPWGVEDLLNLKLRLSPCYKGNKYFEEIFKERIISKKWLAKWPKLIIIQDKKDNGSRFI